MTYGYGNTTLIAALEEAFIFLKYLLQVAPLRDLSVSQALI
jgi:hypothetical protein